MKKAEELRCCENELRDEPGHCEPIDDRVVVWVMDACQRAHSPVHALAYRRSSRTLNHNPTIANMETQRSPLGLACDEPWGIEAIDCGVHTLLS